jgi:hypothetical protein
MRLTPDQIAELERLDKAATPWDWEVYSEPDVGMPATLMHLQPFNDRVVKYTRHVLEPLTGVDLDMIAAAKE